MVLWTYLFARLRIQFWSTTERVIQTDMVGTRWRGRRRFSVLQFKICPNFVFNYSTEGQSMEFKEVFTIQCSIKLLGMSSFFWFVSWICRKYMILLSARWAERCSILESPRQTTSLIRRISGMLMVMMGVLMDNLKKILLWPEDDCPPVRTIDPLLRLDWEHRTHTRTPHFIQYNKCCSDMPKLLI